MKKDNIMRVLTFVTGLALAGLLLAACAAAEVPSGAAQATFVVHCYDVGADALEGRPGVLAVERGWRGFREVDRVVYDPRQVTVEQMEGWLREAGTYVRTITEPEPQEQREERKR